MQPQKNSKHVKAPGCGVCPVVPAASAQPEPGSRPDSVMNRRSVVPQECDPPDSTDRQFNEVTLLLVYMR